MEKVLAKAAEKRKERKDEKTVISCTRANRITKSCKRGVETDGKE